MRVLVADVENSVYRHEDKRIDNGPYRSSNRLVSVGYKFVGEETVNYDFYYHNELDKPADPAKFQAALDQADLLVGHNVKHETEWLLESGFTYDGPVFDTMIAAYILNRGLKAELSLEDLCIRYGLPQKKSDLISELWRKGVGFEAMSIDIVEEYGRGDVISTEALYLKMLEEYEKPDNIRLKPVLSLMNEFCFVLAEVERNGIQIDLNALDEVEREFLEEREQLQRSLMDLTHELMGDRPINLNSPEQLSWVLFSRKVKDKNEWARVFNIGVDHRGKPKPRPRMKDGEFRQNVSRHTEVLYRQKAHQCPDCKGTGRIQKFKKDGTPYKNTNRCKTCDATGLVYEDLNKIAGLKLKPGGIKDVSANGFSTSKDALQFYANSLRGQGNEVGAQFLENMIRLNAVDSYLSTFVNGIRRATIPQTSRLHTNFNQCVTATGRLSSSDPNFQNQPRGSTFPVRRCVVSRFEGGSIIEADFGQLEFRVAGFLAQDQQVLYDVLQGVDIHNNTAKALTEAGQPTDRQGAKANTFGPLYGKSTGTPAEIAYFDFFLNRYSGIAEWHERLCETALRTGIISIPSGREYAFPNAERMWNGNVRGRTQIVNYPVQGFATADIVPLACIRLYRLMKKHKVKSLFVLQVHDSIVIDCYPGEEELMVQLLTEAMVYIAEEMKERWGVEYNFPVTVEIARGSNWMNTEVVAEQEWRPEESERMSA